MSLCTEELIFCFPKEISSPHQKSFPRCSAKLLGSEISYRVKAKSAQPDLHTPEMTKNR
jgi:hypothetical protein